MGLDWIEQSESQDLAHFTSCKLILSPVIELSIINEPSNLLQVVRGLCCCCCSFFFQPSKWVFSTLPVSFLWIIIVIIIIVIIIVSTFWAEWGAHSKRTKSIPKSLTKFDREQAIAKIVGVLDVVNISFFAARSKIRTFSCEMNGIISSSLMCVAIIFYK